LCGTNTIASGFPIFIAALISIAKPTNCHQAARVMDIQGKSGPLVPSIVTFDDPYIPAGTSLHGGYPTARIDWGDGVWKIAPPDAKFGTFHVALVDPARRVAQFKFSAPRIFVGIDVCNDGPKAAQLIVRSAEQTEQAITITLRAGELRKIRTGWIKPSSAVEFEFQNAGALRFDNLACAEP
jgi:hypothetical protein